MTVWMDRAPEFDLAGLAEYLAYAVFAEVCDALEDRIDAKKDDSSTEEEGDDE